MTFDVNVPNNAQSPGLFPAQNQTNYNRLKTIVTANHKFNDTSASDDGFHTDIMLLPQAVPGNLASAGQAFSNSTLTNNPLAYKDTSNAVYQITPCLPLRASVLFPPGASPIIQASFNVSSVTQVTGGTYTINFTTPIPSANYYWLLSMIPTSSSGAINVTGKTLTAANTSNFSVTARGTNGAANDTFQTICAMFFGG